MGSMLIGERVALRARRHEDTAALHAAMFDDPAERVLTSGQPWRPLPVGLSPFRPREEPDPALAIFSVVERTDGQPLVGSALLWGIDEHNRFAHLGVSLLPAHRGRGLAPDVIGVLCRYAFVTLGLHRLALETLGSNAPMIATARRCGFVEEGRLREVGWVEGRFEDEVLFGLLRAEWAG